MTSKTDKEHVAMLRIENVSKFYQGKPVLDDVSLRVEAGEVFGLLGPNGAGKTTLMKMIAGLSRPHSGSLYILGLDGVKERAAIKQKIGWVPQENNLERELNVQEALTLYAWLFGVSNIKCRVKQIMTEFNLEDMRDKRTDTLSGGMARRVLIARAVLPEPQILLLDEPTVGLDPDVRQDIWEMIRDLAGKGKTIFMTTHYMDEAEQLCNRLALLKSGKLLLTGTPEKIKDMAEGKNDPTFTLEKAFLRLIRKEVQ